MPTLSARYSARFYWLADGPPRAQEAAFIILTTYMVATLATACSWNLVSFALFRFVTGAEIGGEYTAVN